MTAALDKLNAAIQEFALTRTEEPCLIDVAVVAWEAVSYDEDGDVQRQIRYAIPTDNFSISAVLGLLDAARTLVRHDTLPSEED